MKELIYSKLNFKVSEEFRILEVTGIDSEDFLNRQVTSDVINLPPFEFQMSSRLDRNGRVHSFFYILKESKQCFKIVVNKAMLELIHKELDKFLIMEDVEINLSNSVPVVYFGIASTMSTPKSESCYHGRYYDLPAVISLNTKIKYEINEELNKFLSTTTAWPILDDTLFLNNLVNESRLNEQSVSYKKGCFLGQETVSKIETRRGASKYPTWIESSNFEEDKIFIENKEIDIISSVTFNNKKIYLTNLSRNFRVDNLLKDNYKILLKSPLGELVGSNQSEAIYHEAINLFHKNRNVEAIELIDISIFLNPNDPDLYESRGAILGQMGRHEEAIEEMDKLLDIDPDSVMAHTNKSLYLMKLGKIEEAEEEKSLATVAGFKKLGKDAKAKKELEKIKIQAEEELMKREQMFKQVLEIDEDDDIANYGMADISFRKSNYEVSLNYLENVLKNKPKYSQAYLLKGKNLEAINKIDEAKIVYTLGIKIAAEAGELMPANEMQSRLSKLLN